MALHSRDVVTVSAAVASRSRADCSSMEDHSWRYQPKHSPSFFFFFRYKCRAEFSHNRTLEVGEFRVGGGVHDSYTFQDGLVGSFTSPGIDAR